MKRILAISVVCVQLCQLAFAQIKSPEEFLGYPLGSKFSYHHRIVSYYEHVAANSDKVSLIPYGETNEGRPLMVAVVSSAANHQNLETIRENNILRTRAESAQADGIAIVWLSYNVHGNEASASEAAIQTLYTLATTADQQEWLNNAVVIMDPCINPDGRDRYANWYNQIGGTTANANLDDIEHSEPWPSGRPNHYLFDLNRDWAWQTQVESQQRMKLYRQWMPHVHVDFHEQFINSPYYFAPAAEPFHEAVSDFQRDFQTRIGENHARYFDQNGWLYFTKEVFDLLYPSYGDTYPTFNGAVGMTYEQAGHGMAGLASDIEGNDTLTLLDRLTHHHTTGISTIEVAAKSAEELSNAFADYFKQGKENPAGKYKSYVIPYRGQEDKVLALKKFLDLHGIEYEFSNGGKALRGYSYQTGKEGSYAPKSGDLVISTYQAQSVLVNVLFEPITKLSTNVTYDITAWSLPYVYGVEAYASEQRITAEGSPKELEPELEVQEMQAPDYGYLLPYHDLKDAQVLAQWFQAGLQVRQSQVPFSQGGTSFPRGTLILLRADNPSFTDRAFVNAAYAPLIPLQRTNNLVETETGWVDSGKDFGSSSVVVLRAPKVAVLGGQGTSSLTYGETWYYFEQVLGYPVTRIQVANAGGVNWSDYDVVVMPTGGYGAMRENGLSALSSWVQEGGTLLALGGATGVLAGHDDFGLARKTPEEEEEDEEADYRNRIKRFGDQETSFLDYFNPGAIFEVTLDETHPLAFGYGNKYFSLKTGSSAYEYLAGGWNVGYLEASGAPRAGFVGKDLQENLAESLVLGVEPMGSGAVVYMPDNPLFRAFWRNGHLMVANAVFFID